MNYSFLFALSFSLHTKTARATRLSVESLCLNEEEADCPSSSSRTDCRAQQAGRRCVRPRCWLAADLWAKQLGVQISRETVDFIQSYIQSQWTFSSRQNTFRQHDRTSSTKTNSTLGTLLYWSHDALSEFNPDCNTFGFIMADRHSVCSEMGRKLQKMEMWLSSLVSVEWKLTGETLWQQAGLFTYICMFMWAAWEDAQPSPVSSRSNLRWGET